MFTGIFESGKVFYNSTKQKKERITRILRIYANKTNVLHKAYPGEIVGLIGLKYTEVGDTITDEMFCNETLENIKFTEPSVFCNIVPATKEDSDKLIPSLQKMHAEDNSFVFKYNNKTQQIIIAGQGFLHLKTTNKILNRKYNIKTFLKPPKVFLRETIKQDAEVVFFLRKQSGGRGQYAKVHIKITKQDDFEPTFSSSITQGKISAAYIKAMAKNFRSIVDKGVVFNYPLAFVRVELIDGSEHPVDSSELAFNIALERAIQQGVKQKGVYLLEPFVSLIVYCPQQYVGKIYNNCLNNKIRGQINNQTNKEKFSVLQIELPKSSTFTYQDNLRKISNGRAFFDEGEMRDLDFRKMPASVQKNYETQL